MTRFLTPSILPNCPACGDTWDEMEVEDDDARPASEWEEGDEHTCADPVTGCGAVFVVVPDGLKRIR